MKHSLTPIVVLFVLFSGCLSNNLQPTINDQNYIQPTVVIPQSQPQPETLTQTQTPTLNNQPQAVPQSQPVVNNDQKQAQNQNNNPKSQQGVLISNQNINGIQGQAIPIDPTKTDQINQPRPQMTDQTMAKARQQADKAKKMAEQARKQAEGDRKERDQRQDEQLRKIQANQTLSKTQRKKQEERLMFRKASRSVQNGTRFIQYLFEQGLGASQFFINTPASQQVAINLYTYVSQDNTYIRTKNIEEEEPVKLYIYQNNQHIIHQSDFYYQNYVVFQAQQGAMYLIKVVNNGRTKLISMNCKRMVEETHIKETLMKDDSEHVKRTQNLAIDINRWHQQFRKLRMLDFQDLKAVQGFIEKYYSWQIVETVVAIVLCVLQVKLIQNMFKGNSIV